MSDEPELSRLIDEVRSGRRASLDALVRRVQARVHRWAARITGDDDSADDIAQDVLIGLERRLDKYQGRSRFSTWLFSVTRNAALEHERAEHRRAAKRAILSTHVVSTTSDARTAHDEQAVAALVLRYVDALPRGQRQIFEAVDLRGREPADVARELGMEQSTVRAHLFKARRAIRARMLERHEPLLKEFFS